VITAVFSMHFHAFSTECLTLVGLVFGTGELRAGTVLLRDNNDDNDSNSNDDNDNNSNDNNNNDDNDDDNNDDTMNNRLMQ
jgi:hypothetical protein